MPLLAYHAGELIPDFQSAATPETLLRNAQARGLDPEKVEVREVSEEEFAAALKPYQDAAAAAAAAQLAADQQTAARVLQRLGVTAEEFAALLRVGESALNGGS
jgi:hypothetical protein